jgi:hypothetical protein
MPKRESSLPSLSILEQWESEGIPCYYVRFHQSVPTFINKEPVAEFSLKNKNAKYEVERITYTPHGLVWRAGGEIDISSLANVMYVRVIF